MRGKIAALAFTIAVSGGDAGHAADTLPLLGVGAGAGWTLVAHVSAQAANSAQTTAINTSASPGPATLLVAAIGYSGSVAVQDSRSNTWTAAKTQANGGIAGGLYYVYSPTTSATHTFTCVGTSNFCTITVEAWVRPPGGTAAIDQVTSANVTGATLAPGSITPLFANELVVTSLTVDVGAAGITISPLAPAAGGFTISDSMVGVGSVAEGGAIAYLVQSAAAAANPAWSWTGGSILAASIIASFR